MRTYTRCLRHLVGMPREFRNLSNLPTSHTPAFTVPLIVLPRDGLGVGLWVGCPTLCELCISSSFGNLLLLSLGLGLHLVLQFGASAFVLDPFLPALLDPVKYGLVAIACLMLQLSVSAADVLRWRTNTYDCRPSSCFRLRPTPWAPCTANCTPVTPWGASATFRPCVLRY